MSAEGNTSNEEFMDDQLPACKRRNGADENPNLPEEASSDPPCKKKKKDQRRDIGWRHGEMLSEMKQHWKCNYCGLVRHGGGVTRLKLHLVGGSDVRKCESVPDHVVEEILASLKEKGREKVKEKEKKKKERENKDKNNKGNKEIKKENKEKSCGKRGRKKKKKKSEEESDYEDDGDEDEEAEDDDEDYYYEVCEDEGRNPDTDSEAEDDASADSEAEEDASADSEEEKDANAETEAVEEVKDKEKWKSWKHVLENMLPGGIGKDDSELQSCIQNALSHETGSDNLENQEGSRRETTTTTKCKEALVNTLNSEKFATLCNLLRNTFINENSEEEKRNFFDLSEIDAKLKNGDYEGSPQMFIRDLRKVWDKFGKVGRELVRVSNSLSIVSRNNIEKEVGIQIKSDSDNSNRLEPDEKNPSQICNHCRFEIIYNWGVISCKGCNTTFHKSCINPLINPSSNHWFCSLCMSNNLELDLISSDTEGSDSDNSDSVQPCITAIYKLCKICGGKEEGDKEFLVCAHPECPYKYYHTKCLTKSLISNGTQASEIGYCWYCPSCLCRVCLCDKDDDKIVLCDGCDEAFHIYCMDPPRESVPEGKWFCQKCSKKRKREKEKKKKKKSKNDGVSMNDKKGIIISGCSSQKNDGKYYKPETHKPMDLLLGAVEVFNAKEGEANIES